MFLVLLEIAGDFHIAFSVATLFTFTFFSLHWAIPFSFAKSFVHVMSCHLQLNFLSYITKR